MPRHVRRNEAGVAELAVCFAAFCFLTLLGIQLALWQHAIHLAQDAADHGDTIARAYGSSLGAGARAASRFVGETGPNMIVPLQVTTADLPGGIAQVTVSGDAEWILPDVIPRSWLHVSATAAGPVAELR